MGVQAGLGSFREQSWSGVLALRGFVSSERSSRGDQRARGRRCPGRCAGLSRPVAGPVKRQVAVKSTRGFALKSTHGIAIKATPLAAADKGESAGPVRRSTRQFYDGEENCYIIDAKLEGNLGRYLNVSGAQGHLGAQLCVRRGCPSPGLAENGESGKRAGSGG